MSDAPLSMLRWIAGGGAEAVRLAQFRQCAVLVSDRSGFVNIKMRTAQLFEMDFKRAERGDEDA